MNLLIFAYEIRILSKNEIEKAAEKWAKNEAIYKRKTNYSKFAKARFIRDAEHWFEMIGCLKRESKQPFPFEEYLNKYKEK